MKYIPLDQYKKAWIFRHKDVPVSESDLSDIKPMSEPRAEQLWAEYISRDSSHPEHFSAPDWAADSSCWKEKDFWQGAWDSDQPQLPELLQQHLQAWEDDVTVYFCYQADHVIETKWAIFRRNWKNFLFFDNGPILLGKRRKQVVQFFDDGTFRIGERP